MILAFSSGTKLDSTQLKGGLYVGMLFDEVFERADDCDDLHSFALYFVQTIAEIIRGVKVVGVNATKLCEHRTELLKAVPSALIIFEKTYPDLNFREELAAWLSISNYEHAAYLPAVNKFSLPARIAAAWWGARISCSASHIISPKELDAELWRIYERRDEIDKVYRELLDGIATRVDNGLYLDRSMKIHRDFDWMCELAGDAGYRLAGLGEGSGVWFTSDDTMKVTPTRILLTSNSHENRELYPGVLAEDTVSNPPDNMLLGLCSRSCVARSISFAEYCLDD